MKNIAKCAKCGDVIRSIRRHDFIQCRCGAIFTDGGESSGYIRRGGNPEDFAEVTEEDEKKARTLIAGNNGQP